jgi:hypothetical protein
MLTVLLVYLALSLLATLTITAACAASGSCPRAPRQRAQVYAKPVSAPLSL